MAAARGNAGSAARPGGRSAEHHLGAAVAERVAAARRPHLAAGAPRHAVPPLAHFAGPDPERLTAWVVINPATETRGQPPAWDRPQLTTDPTADASRDLALAPPSGLRETPPPFVRLNIPDPFEQIAIAELRNPPPELDPPVTTLTRPPIKLIETVAAK